MAHTFWHVVHKIPLVSSLDHAFSFLLIPQQTPPMLHLGSQLLEAIEHVRQPSLLSLDHRQQLREEENMATHLYSQLLTEFCRKEGKQREGGRRREQNYSAIHNYSTRVFLYIHVCSPLYIHTHLAVSDLDHS